jgi:3-isopropylmalate dehydratase small subunit
MAYDKFNILTSTAVPLSIENVDTDQIIPARFLKATERVGFGDNLSVIGDTIMMILQSQFRSKQLPTVETSL